MTNHVALKFLNRLFPFFFTINRKLEVFQSGNKLKLLCPEIKPTSKLEEIFSLENPKIEVSFENINATDDTHFFWKSRRRPDLTLKGQMLLIEENELHFIGSPWVLQMKDLNAMGLQLSDFPLHDSMSELLVLKSLKEGALNDAKRISGELQAAFQIINRSQARFQALVQATADIIAILDEQFCFKYHSPSLERLLDRYTRDVSQSKLLDWTHPDDRNRLLHNLDNMLTQKEAIKIQFRLKADQQGWRIIDAVFQDKRSDPDVAGLVMNARDVTEQCKMEENLLKAKKLESLGVLAGGIAHDFNNILTSLFGFQSLAKKKISEDHAAQTYLATAGKALERATNLTNQLLTFAKGGAPILETVNLAQLVKDSTQFNLSGSNVKLLLNIHENLWEISADKGQVFQIIANLAINAKQAMPEGGTLHIDMKNIEEIEKKKTFHLAGDFVMLSMKDEGMGISKKHIEKIFDPFFTTKKTGSGLGLATVYKIISKHNGHISVDSKLGEGSTFTIYFPAKKESKETTKTLSSTTHVELKTASVHVLVMDDEEMIRELAESMLESKGFTSDSAVDGEEALKKYMTAKKSDRPFDIVIMDLTIPGGMGGKEAIRKLLSIHPEAKVIVSSGYSEDPILANFEDYGFRGRLIKPFIEEDLEKEVARVITL